MRRFIQKFIDIYTFVLSGDCWKPRDCGPIWIPENLKMPSFDFSHDPIYPTWESMKRPDGSW